MPTWLSGCDRLQTRWKVTIPNRAAGERRHVVRSEKPRQKVLFLCTGNSCRSQMAEGWARHLKGDALEGFSAGVEPHGMNQNAVAVMREAGVDISRNRSKHVDELNS